MNYNNNANTLPDNNRNATLPPKPFNAEGSFNPPPLHNNTVNHAPFGRGMAAGAPFPFPGRGRAQFFNPNNNMMMVGRGRGRGVMGGRGINNYNNNFQAPIVPPPQLNMNNRINNNIPNSNNDKNANVEPKIHVYIGNIPTLLNNEQQEEEEEIKGTKKIIKVPRDHLLRTLFEQIGDISRWRRIVDPVNSEPKQFGFLSFNKKTNNSSCVDMCELCIHCLNGLLIAGSRLIVKPNSFTSSLINNNNSVNSKRVQSAAMYRMNKLKLKRIETERQNVLSLQMKQEKGNDTLKSNNEGIQAETLNESKEENNDGEDSKEENTGNPSTEQKDNKESEINKEKEIDSDNAEVDNTENAIKTTNNPDEETSKDEGNPNTNNNNNDADTANEAKEELIQNGDKTDAAPPPVNPEDDTDGNDSHYLTHGDPNDPLDPMFAFQHESKRLTLEVQKIVDNFHDENAEAKAASELTMKHEEEKQMHEKQEEKVIDASNDDNDNDNRDTKSKLVPLDLSAPDVDVFLANMKRKTMLELDDDNADDTNTNTNTKNDDHKINENNNNKKNDNDQHGKHAERDRDDFSSSKDRNAFNNNASNFGNRKGAHDASTPSLNSRESDYLRVRERDRLFFYSRIRARESDEARLRAQLIDRDEQVDSDQEERETRRLRRIASELQARLNSNTTSGNRHKYDDYYFPEGGDEENMSRERREVVLRRKKRRREMEEDEELRKKFNKKDDDGHRDNGENAEIRKDDEAVNTVVEDVSKSDGKYNTENTFNEEKNKGPIMKIGFDIQNNNNNDTDNINSNGFTYEDDEEEQHNIRPLVPLDYSDNEEDNNIDCTDDDTILRSLISLQSSSSKENIDSEEIIFSLPVEWDVLLDNNNNDDNTIANVCFSHLRDWLNAQILQLLDVEEPSMVEFILEQLLQKCSPKVLLDEFEPILDDSAKDFVSDLWKQVVLISYKEKKKTIQKRVT